MKIIGTFGVVVIASIALLQPAEGRQRGGGGGRALFLVRSQFFFRVSQALFQRSQKFFGWQLALLSIGPALFLAAVVPTPGLLFFQLIPAFLFAGGVAQPVLESALRVRIARPTSTGPLIRALRPIARPTLAGGHAPTRMRGSRPTAGLRFVPKVSIIMADASRGITPETGIGIAIIIGAVTGAVGGTTTG